MEIWIRKIISGYNISEKEIGLQSEIKKGEAFIQFYSRWKSKYL